MKTPIGEAKTFFSELLGGDHHVPNNFKEYGDGWCITTPCSLSTFDGDMLTRLVVLSHSKLMRAEVSRAGMRLRIAVWKRQATGSLFERHPSLEDLIKSCGGTV